MTDYLNSIPLAAIAGYGDVFGLGDGLHAWYGADVQAVNEVLSRLDPHLERAGPARAQTAMAYRQALSLLVAVKQPSAYLSRDRDALDTRTNADLRALASVGIIPEWPRDETLRVQVTLRTRVDGAGPATFAERTAVDTVRAGLSAQLGLASLHDLDRLDLTVRTTLDGTVNDAVTHALQGLGNCGEAATAGLIAFRLLMGNDCGHVVYSVTLYERVPAATRCACSQTTMTAR